MPAPWRPPPTVRSCARPRVEPAHAAPLLEQLEPFQGNPHPAQGRVVPAEFRVAVPIGAAADAEPEPLRDACEPLLDGRRVAGMAYFQPVEALLLKLPQLAFGAVVPQMRRDGHRADRVQQLRDVGEARERLFDVRGAAAPEVAAKRVANAVTGIALDQG